MSGKETKTIQATIKEAGDEGSFEAVIATTGVVDSDGDIVEPGSLAGKTLFILPAHDSWHVPLGKATIDESGNLAIASGQFNLEIGAARDWHSSMKFDLANPPALQEFSWDLIPTKAEPDTVDGRPVRRLYEFDSKEMSLVLRGASVGTRTLAVKAHSEKSETSNAVWDETLAMRALMDCKSPEDALAGAILHHYMDEDGVGAASIRACFLGIAKINSGKVFEKRRQTYDHLAGHLKDAGIEPPELRPESDLPGMKLADRLRFATWEVETAIAHLNSAAEARKSRGRDLSEPVRAEAIEMASAFAEMKAAAEQLEAMVDDCSSDEAVGKALSAWAVTRARWGGSV